MEISKSIKRVLASVSTLALLVSSTPIAFAQTYNDVGSGHWAFDFIEQLVDEGVFDVSDNFRPNDSMNRAELVKTVIEALGGLSDLDYEAPASPTFVDVADDAWFYDYVEAAVQNDIVSGYTDSQGQLTGDFGPSDTVNRAAATKILVNAFGVPFTLSPGSPFGDVPESAWFHDYVLTAYNQSVLDGYDNGNFGPADPLTRAQVAKLTVNAQDPIPRFAGDDDPGDDDPGDDDPVDPSGEGALELSLNDDTAPSSTLPLSANGVEVATFDFTAADDDVGISNLVVTRGGVGKVGDWEELFLYEGSSRLTTGRTINNDTNTATFPLKVTVEAGTTKTLRLVGDVDAGAGASNQHYFYVASAADVTSNAQSVAGDFPVAGNTFTMGGANTVANTVTVQNGSAIAQPRIGELDAEVGSFKLIAGSTNDLAVHMVTVTQNGSLSSSKLENCRLLRGNDEVASAAGFENDRIAFELNTPYVIEEGQTKNFFINCDVNGGRTSDEVQLYLDEDTDLLVIDQQYGFGARVVNENFNTATVAETNLQGGNITITDNGPAAEQVAQNTTNIHLLDWSVAADRDIRVKDMDITVTVQNAAATGPNTGTGQTQAAVAVGDGDSADDDTGQFCVVPGALFAVGDTISVVTANGTEYAIITALNAAHADCNTASNAATTRVDTNSTSDSAVTAGAGNAAEVNPYTLVKNVKVVDLDTNSTLQGPMTLASDGTLTAGPPSTYSKKFTEDYELVGGDVRHLGLLVDLDQNMPAGYRIFGNIDYTTAAGYLKDDNANENVAVADIVGGDLTGNQHTTATNSLTVALASTPVSQTYVKGDDDVPALGMSMTAGDAGEITVKKLTVRVYADTATGAAFSATGDTAANTVVSSVTLMDGNDVVAGPESLSAVGGTFVADTPANYYQAQFDNLDLAVEAGSTRTLTAHVKLLNNAAANRYVAVDILPGTDIIAEDFDANSINATGNQLNNASPHGVELTVLTQGTLTAFSETNPDADILLAGSTGQKVANYRFHANDESWIINKLTVMNDAAGAIGTAVATGAVTNVSVKYTDMNGQTQTKSGNLAGGAATISGLEVYVPKDEDAFVEVWADVTSMAGFGEGLSGQTFRLGIQDAGNDVTSFEAVGQSSSTTDNFTDGDEILNQSTVNTFVVRKTKPTFAKATGLSSSLIAGENRLYGFTVSADSAGSLSFGRLSFTVTNSSGQAAADLSAFKFYRGSTLLDTTRVEIYNGTTGSADLQTGGAGDIQNGATDDAIVAFLTEESVAAGSTQTYYLDATLEAAAATNETVSTKLAIGDEAVAVAGIVATTTCGAGDNVVCSTGNGNTGLISDKDANEALFATGAAAADFSDLTVAGRAQIWSDKSADAHAYPTITINAAADTKSTVTDGTGSYDWTNGNLLNLTEVSSFTLTY